MKSKIHERKTKHAHPLLHLLQKPFTILKLKLSFFSKLERVEYFQVPCSFNIKEAHRKMLNEKITFGHSKAQSLIMKNLHQTIPKDLYSIHVKVYDKKNNGE